MPTIVRQPALNSAWPLIQKTSSATNCALKLYVSFFDFSLLSLSYIMETCRHTMGLEFLCIKATASAIYITAHLDSAFYPPRNGKMCIKVWPEASSHRTRRHCIVLLDARQRASMRVSVPVFYATLRSLPLTSV